MAKASKKNEKHHYTHKEGAPWITTEVCRSYAKQGAALSIGTDTGARRALRLELQKKYDIDELDAINIINGYYIGDIVNKYDRIRKILTGELQEDAVESQNAMNREFLEWMEEKNKKNNKLDDFGLLEDD